MLLPMSQWVWPIRFCDINRNFSCLAATKHGAPIVFRQDHAFYQLLTNNCNPLYSHNLYERFNISVIEQTVLYRCVCRALTLCCFPPAAAHLHSTVTGIIRYNWEQLWQLRQYDDCNNVSLELTGECRRGVNTSAERRQRGRCAGVRRRVLAHGRLHRTVQGQLHAVFNWNMAKGYNRQFLNWCHRV